MNRTCAFPKITFHAGCRHKHFWQGVAWMVRPICAHRAQLQKLIIWLLGIYILEAWKVIAGRLMLCFPMLISSLPDANPLPPEHKIEVFVLFWPPEPTFSGISSTKSAFLCAFTLRSPRFRAFRAQNRVFCAREE